MSTMIMTSGVSSAGVRTGTTGSAARFTAVTTPGSTEGRGPVVSRAGMRLTRRGRVVLAVVGLLVAGGLGSVMTQAVAGEPAEPQATTSVVVAPGASLWTIAEEITPPGEDVRDVVAEIATLNDLDELALRAGQELLLPAP